MDYCGNNKHRSYTWIYKGIYKAISLYCRLGRWIACGPCIICFCSEKLAEELGTSLTFAQVVAFILIWLLVPLVFLLLASALTRVIEIVHLGFVNRILGAALGALKYILLVSLFVHFIEFVDSKDNLIKSTVKRTSLLYYPIEGFSGVFFPTVKNVTKQLID